MGTSETLRSVLDAGSTTKRLDELSTARVIGQTALKVHAAQQKAGAGKAVGPITPLAISIASNGEIALALGQQPGASSYSAPESFGGSTDRRSDVFSLGILMWEALTHQRLFEGASLEAVKAAIKTQGITPPAELNANIPAELSAICMKALARTPAERYQSTKVMAVEIEEMLSEAGYADNDEQVAAFVAELPRLREAAHAKPAAAPSPRAKTPSAQPMPIPRVASPANSPAAAPVAPTMLTAAPTAPAELPTVSPSATMLGAPLGPAPASPAPPLPQVPAKPKLPAARSAPPVDVTPRPAVDGTAPPFGGAAGRGHAPAVDGPSVIASAPRVETPPPEELKLGGSTQPGFAPPPVVEPTLVLTTPPGITVMPASAPAPREAPPYVARSHDSHGAGASETMPVGAAVPVVAQSGSPHPASVVSLPPAPGTRAAELRDATDPGRKSQEVLGNWGWGTDSVAAISDDDDYAPPPSSGRTLLLLIGGGLVLALVVTVIAVSGHGSKKKEDPSAAAKPASSDITAKSDPVKPDPAIVPAGSDLGSNPGSEVGSNSGSQAVAAVGSGSSTEPGGSTDVIGATGSAAQPAVATDLARPDAGAPEPVVVAPKVEPEPKRDPKARIGKTETKTETKTKTEAKTEAKIETKVDKTTKTTKTDKIAKIETKAKDSSKVTKVGPKSEKAIKVEPKDKTPKADKPDVETAYRIGIQQFARGDTGGALTSLRTSLAGNPNYPPTWRGLGLVFEKMGEKDQARAAFRRYLQLSPAAGDAAQIRTRLERLGT